jgi:2-C-methyl-D-erythritol 4-phosphate cytidylyltransferase
MSARATKFWTIIPAAGKARRMQQAVPKQHLSLAGRSVIEWAVEPFVERADCAGVVVVIAADDERWQELVLSRHAKVHAVASGGAERSDSVFAGMQALRDRCSDNDWVLVHDAARPCLERHDLDSLIATVRDDEVGGLLAAPVVDTLKRADAGQRVESTVGREKLWRALTPQMFRYGVLSRALSEAAQRRLPVTDEAQAVELLGLRPLLVAGSANNFKITIAEDLERAERILAERKR